MNPASLFESPNALARYYSRFRVQERLLLTGHSHQAWPDCALDGQRQAWLDAAEHIDEKWERAFAMAERVRRGFARLLDDSEGGLALGANTHELLVRFLSALPLRERPRVVTTDGEFHSLRRQLDRLSEEKLDIVKVSALPTDTLSQRLIDAADDRTSAVMVSAVLFQNAHIVPHLGDVQRRCEQVGAELLIDAYHALNVVPFSLPAEGAAGAFVVGGGYKYCQLGEGNCFLRIPPACSMRPVVTGWFAEFEALTDGRLGESVPYPNGAGRFAGATYDPTSHYRAAEVFRFFEERNLSPELLRGVSQHQVGVLQRTFDDLDLDPSVIRRDHETPLQAIGGFLALDSPHAEELHRQLRERGVSTDCRGETLRFGPAPYLSDEQLMAAMRELGESAASLLRAC